MSRMPSTRMPSNFKKFNLTAFTLIEITLVLLIISIVIAGVTSGSLLMKKANLATAANKTRNSPVTSLSSVFSWFETSRDISFSQDFVRENEIGLSEGEWNDSSPNSTSLTIAGSGDQIIYSNTINDIPAIKFQAGQYFELNGSFLNNSDYTITLIDKRLVDSDNNFFIGDASNDTSNSSLLLGYDENAVVIHSQSGDSSDNSYSANIDSFSSSSGSPRIFTFIHSSREGNKTYINGYLASSDSSEEAKTHLSNISSLQFGKGYSGEIGEIIFFTDSLSNRKRREVEKYIADKFDVKKSLSYVLDLDSTSSELESLEGCNGGTVGNDGCSQTCSISIAGVTTPSTVDSGSGTISCNQEGYTGSINYTCSSSIFTSNDSCSCDTGYSLISGTCQASCAVSSIVGIEDSSVNAGTGTISCNSTGYSTSDSINYSCSSGTFSISSGACDTCATGYELVDGECIEEEMPVSCSGGNETSSGGYTYHAFTSGSSTFSCTGDAEVQVLVVAGGGGGGGGTCGGGAGAGGVVYNTSYSIAGSTNIAVTVGSGGAGGGVTNSDTPENGDDSVFGTITAIGGGAGGQQFGPGTFTENRQGKDGGSGGGIRCNSASHTTYFGAALQPTSSSGGYGSAGGTISTNLYGSGGGGAGSAGSGDNVGDGGSGIQISAFSQFGESGYFAGGGAGSGRNGHLTEGGIGGGGDGGTGSSGTDGGNGATNTGGGGSGCWQSCTGGTGGSGVVLVRYESE